MIIAFVVAALALLYAVTLVGTWQIEAGYPPAGRFVAVDGGRLHIVELGPADAPAIVLLHGASGNLGDMRIVLGERLAQRYRVILVDRPGHGWSDRPGGRADASPLRQAELIHQALLKIGVTRSLMLGHSWSGALATAYTLAFPEAVSGLILLAPVTHPWPGGIGWINDVAAMPVIGPLIAHTLILPAGYFMLTPGAISVFRPQSPPPDYVARTGAAMILRSSEFIANAQDLAVLKEFVRAQVPHYAEIKAPVAIVSGDIDPIVYTDIHSRAIAKQLPHATLTVLPGIGHMVHDSATDEVVQAIDKVAAEQR
jgi:pimeloyl-ACP methyl ester carboxylesterase